MATYGAQPHGADVPTWVRQQAYASVNDEPATAAGELQGDIAKGRLFLFTTASKSATRDPMESKLTFATQSDAANPDVVQNRYISDPRVAVNERVFIVNRPACVIPRHQNSARRLLCCKRRYPGVPVMT